jgi:hypothetical protein
MPFTKPIDWLRDVIFRMCKRSVRRVQIGGVGEWTLADLVQNHAMPIEISIMAKMHPHLSHGVSFVYQVQALWVNIIDPSIGDNMVHKTSIRRFYMMGECL